MKRLLPFLLTLSIFLTLPSSVSAQVVINEINASGEWVELFKTGSGTVILDGCTIYFHDNDSQKKILTSSDNFLDSEFYKVITTGGSYLNNSSSDTVLLDCQDFDTGPAVYPDNLGTKSYARIPNGIGEFIVTSDISQGQENPNPTPSPSTIPPPTQAPTNAPTSAPTSSPNTIPTKTATPIPSKTLSPKPTSTSTPETTELSSEVLGESVEVTPTATALTEGGQNKKKFPFLPIIFIGSGVLMIGFAVYNLVRAKKNPVQV